MGLFGPIIEQYLGKVAACVTGDVLDVGCGDKPYRKVFINAKSYVGVDWSSDINVARSNNAERKRALDVVGSAEALPFRCKCFDSVLATQLIEHLPHPALFFAEVSRVLRPSGCLIITFPLIGPLHEEPHDYFRYTEYGVQELCQESGLQVETIRKMGGGWLAIGYLAREFLYADAGVSKSWFGRRFFRLLGSLTYSFLSYLDRFAHHPEGTLNYLMVARKLR